MALPLTSLVELAIATRTEEDINLAIKEAGYRLAENKLSVELAQKIINMLNGLRTVTK